MITVGLPSITSSLDVTFAQSSWIITIYLIIMTVTQPIAGKLGDMFGHRNLFLFGLFLFFGASLVCSFASNLTILIVGRSIQAIGGALLTPNGTAILRFITPKEMLSKVFGFFGFSMSIGAAIGPMIGAALIGLWGWQSTFWVNIPLAILSFAFAFKYLPKSDQKGSSVLDLLGSFWMGSALTSLVLIVTHKAYTNLYLWAIFVGASILFVHREKSFTHPLIDFKLFAIPLFANSNVAILLTNSVMYGTLLLMPIVLQHNLGYDVMEIGLFLLVFSVAISFSSWFGGHMASKYSKHLLIGGSFAISLMAVALYAFIPYVQSAYLIGVMLVLGGIGSGMGLPAIQTIVMQVVPKEVSGVASGISSTFRYVGSTISSVVISLQFAYSFTVAILFALSVLGVCLSFGFKEVAKVDTHAKESTG